MSFFWNGYILRDFIFFNFNTNTVPGFIGVFIALFSVGILYEALFYLKKDLLQRFLLLKSRRHQNPFRRSYPTFDALQRSESDDTTTTAVIVDEGAGDANNPRNSLLAGEDLPDDTRENPPSSSSAAERTVENQNHHDNQTPRISSMPPKWLSILGISHPETVYLTISSILHCFYAFIGYTLMNAVMTFNIWVMIAVCAGIGVGYLFFRAESTDSQQKRISNSSSGSQPFRNAIETDDDDFPSQNNERDPLDRSPSSSSSKNKTDNHHLQTPSKKSPGSPGGGSRASRTSSAGRRSRNRERAAGVDLHDAKIPGEESPLRSDHSQQQNGSPVAGHVIVVGAQVHNNYQQSV